MTHRHGVAFHLERVVREVDENVDDLVFLLGGVVSPDDRGWLFHSELAASSFMRGVIERFKRDADVCFTVWTEPTS